MNKIVAVLLAGLAVIVLIAVGWGLVYLPATMSASAQRAIADFQRVLARDAPRFALTHGEISANPLTASVTVADAQLRHADGNVLRAAALTFTVDPYSGEISALDARALGFDKGRTRTRVEQVAVSGLTPETRMLLDRAARGELTLGALLQRLAVAAFRLDGLTLTTPNEGELNLRTIAMEDMRGGIIGRFSMEGLNVYIRSGPNPGEVALRSLEIAGLNFAEIMAAARRPDRLPVFTAPVVRNFNFESFTIQAQELDLTIGRGASDAAYAENDDGRTYARKMTFLMDGIVMKPRGRNAAMAAFFGNSGLDAFRARFNMISTGDHATRTMALEEMSLTMAGLADIDFKLRVGNVPKGAFELSIKPEEMMGLMTELLDATLIDGSLVLTNTQLVQLGMAQAGRKQGLDAKAMILSMLGAARQNARGPAAAFFNSLAGELEKFLDDPKTLRFTVAPTPPLAFHLWYELSKANRPGPLIRALNLKVEANR